MTTREYLVAVAIVCWVVLFVWLVLPIVGIAIANVLSDRRQAAEAAPQQTEVAQ